MRGHMRIAFAVSEMTPFAKTGGLGDVGGALPRVLAGMGHQLIGFLPKYRVIDMEKHHLIKRPEEIRVPMGDRTEAASLWEARRGDVRIIFLDHPGYYDRDGLYQENAEDHPDNAERFIFFSRGILEALRVLDWRPDVIHCNDWQTGLIPAYLKTVYRDDPFFAGMASLLTIHNLAYQGVFPAELFSLTGLPAEVFTPAGMEFWGRKNCLKAGLVYADILNTVSPKYAQEIQTPEHGCGLDGVLRQRAADLYGVLNGVDYDEWNPRTDPYIAAPYAAEDLTGKALCKRDLQEVMALPARPDVPLLGVISRLAHHKGIDLVAEMAPQLLSHDVQLVLLGTGDVWLEQALLDLGRQFPDQMAVRTGFDVGLSHKIEAGADIFLMPSRDEPCGLNQMYSLAYGTIPVVRATGGLDDTIIPFDPGTGTGNGFKFHDANAGELLRAVLAAIRFFRQPDAWVRLVQNAMAADYSWERSAKEYERLYRLALERRRESGP